jgi:hypothetical protein
LQSLRHMEPVQLRVVRHAAGIGGGAGEQPKVEWRLAQSGESVVYPLRLSDERPA